MIARGNIKTAYYCEKDISKNILSKPPFVGDEWLFSHSHLEVDLHKYNLDRTDYSPREYIEFSYDSLQNQIGIKKLWINIFAEGVIDQLDAAIEVVIFAANIPILLNKQLPSN